MIRENVIIIGNGPAGGTAAIYCARANLKPRMFAGNLPGGLLTQTSDIENFPGFPEGIGGFELVMAIQEQAEKFGAQTDYDTIETIKLDPGKLHYLKSSDGREFETPALIIASGATPRYLGVPGEERLRGHGVSACATCDGAFFKDKVVAVAGGGDSAMEEAVFLTRFASVVHLIHRRDQFRASAIMVERAKNNPKIIFHTNCIIEEILGENEVSGLRLKDNNSGTTSVLDCQGFFAALGHIPETQLFREAGVATDEQNYIVTGGKCSCTNIEGVFAAGDCTDPRYRQAIIAAGSGAWAALDVEKYLEHNAAKF